MRFSVLRVLEWTTNITDVVKKSLYDPTVDSDYKIYKYKNILGDNQ